MSNDQGQSNQGTNNQNSGNQQQGIPRPNTRPQPYDIVKKSDNSPVKKLTR